jgi:carbonic anhydrase/acetyltransferase-like protein (isoleucine patch superfamily)
MPIFSIGERRVELRGGHHFIAHNATVIGSVVIGDQSSVWFNVVVRGDNDLITIGNRVNLQDGAILHTDPGIRLTIDSNVSVGHGAMLHGCTIGEATLIGINSVIMNHVVVGRQSIVGANTLIPEGKCFPDGVLILGQPGKVVRELRAEEREFVIQAAETYVQRARLYRSEFKPQRAP